MEPRKYEWCVMMDRHDDEPHRTAPTYLSDDALYVYDPNEDDRPTTEDEQREWCERWVLEWDEMGENQAARKGMFYVARREVGSWERA